jgi:two-component system nitrogen regulation response regulator GlnG
MLKKMAKGNILIADDDAAIRTVLNQALARAGYAPRATGNAATCGTGSARARATW